MTGGTVRQSLNTILEATNAIDQRPAQTTLNHRATIAELLGASGYSGAETELRENLDEIREMIRQIASDLGFFDADATEERKRGGI